MEKKKKVRVLAFDPSITAWGWVLLTPKGRVVRRGCIKTKPSEKRLKIGKGNDRVRRVKELNYVLLGLIRRHNIRLIVTEQPHGSQSASAALMVGGVTFQIQTLSDCFEIPVEWYLEGDCKEAVLGKKNAAKKEMLKRISELYDVDWFNTGYKDEAVADALAVFHKASQSSDLLRMLKGTI